MSFPPSKTPFSTPPAGVAVIGCAVLELEIQHFVREQGRPIHVELLRQGLHNDPPLLRLELQAAIDRVENTTEVNAIVLGYGLCSRGSEGVFTRRAKLVMPRAHDCITILLGSKEHYAEYVSAHPGTYWYSPGWNKHHTPPGKERHDKLLAQYVERYGADNAEYLMQEEQHWFKTYDRATYVDLTVGGYDPKGDIQYTKQCADWLGWSFDRQKGDPELLRAMLSGAWDDERFLVLEPGQTFRMTADEKVIELTPGSCKEKQ